MPFFPSRFKTLTHTENSFWNNIFNRVTEKRSEHDGIEERQYICKCHSEPKPPNSHKDDQHKLINYLERHFQVGHVHDSI
jgi:hypothetical protein